MQKQADIQKIEQSTPAKRSIVRDWLVFQIKLLIDGFRDALLVPISTIIAITDVITGGDRFYKLLKIGKQSDHWINLFQQEEHEDPDFNLDRVFADVETILNEEDPANKEEARQRLKDSVEKTKAMMSSEQKSGR